MITANIATLKAKLSYYLRLVQSGKEVIVTSHRQRVARILPVTASTIEPREPVRPLIDLLKLKGVKRRRSVSAVEFLIEDRRRR